MVGMTDIGLMALVFGLRNLTKLDVSYVDENHDFTDVAIDIINEKFPDLLTLQ